jgi:hypothetical protein
MRGIAALQNQLRLSDSELARRIGANQSSVHRALERDPPRLTPTLRKICNYAENILQADATDFPRRGREQLARAVTDGWDGAPRGLENLLSLLQLLGDFSQKS